MVINLTFFIKYVNIYIVIATFWKTVLTAFEINYKLTNKSRQKLHFMNIMKTNARSQVPQSHVPTKFIALQGAANKNENYPIVHENSKKSNFQIAQNPCK